MDIVERYANHAKHAADHFFEQNYRVAQPAAYNLYGKLNEGKTAENWEIKEKIVLNDDLNNLKQIDEQQDHQP